MIVSLLKVLGCFIYGGFLKWWYPKMDGLEWKTLLKWMIWGYHHLRKHPYAAIVGQIVSSEFASPKGKAIGVHVGEVHSVKLHLSKGHESPSTRNHTSSKKIHF